ncbi:MAG: flagellar filament capping protein FliD [Lachnospiraceae bacterium]|nr:flagellar filament capping protein FliD [Lachnospiraceae bacterium]
MGSLNIYNYYQMALPSIANTKYDSHKKSELKNLYKDMVKLNQSKPFYKLSLSKETRDYVIGIKEAAMELKTSSSFLSEDSDPDSRKMMVNTDQPGNLSVSLLSDEYESMPTEINMSIDQLAATQRNEGKLVPSNSASVPVGKHFINIEKGGSEYQFEIDTKQGETNLHILRRLATSVNSNDIGVSARVMESGTSARLQLEAKDSGLGELDQGLQFQVKGPDDAGMVEYFGLNEVTTYPQNARFTLNGTEQTASSNNISINNGIGIELNHVTSEEAHIKLANDNSALLDDVDDFVHYYNNLVDLAHKVDDNPNGSQKLLRDLGTITRRFRNDLESSGLTLNEDGYLEKDDALLVQSTENGQVQELFQQLSDFKNAVNHATDRITLNPMEYVDKTVVSYPNTQRNFPNPYMPSMYSGMFYNSYV